jgi:hypothetical protein
LQATWHGFEGAFVHSAVIRRAYHARLQAHR